MIFPYCRLTAGAFPRFGNTLLDALVRPCPIEVRCVLAEHPPQVGFAHDHNMVEAFPTNAPHQSFADGIGTRCLDRRSQYLDTCSNSDGFEMKTVLRIIVADQILGRLAEGRRLPQLLSNPLVIR